MRTSLKPNEREAVCEKLEQGLAKVLEGQDMSAVMTALTMTVATVIAINFDRADTDAAVDHFCASLKQWIGPLKPLRDMVEDPHAN